MNFPDGMEAIYHKSKIVQVDLEKCRDWQSFSYTDDGWHYYSALINEYINNPNLIYSESILKTYHDRYQPTSLQDVLFENSLIDKPPIHKNGPPLPWMKISPRFGKVYQHFGPNTDSFVMKDFNLIINLYNKLSKEGYHPEKYQDGYIRGYFLKNYDDYRFIITNGHHRIAALAILKYKKIAVMIDPASPRVVDIEKINEWVNVINGVYSKKLATKIFKIPFTKNGKEKAKALGLYKKIY